MPRVRLPCVIVVFPDNTHLLFNNLTKKIHKWYIDRNVILAGSENLAADMLSRDRNFDKE